MNSLRPFEERLVGENGEPEIMSMRARNETADPRLREGPAGADESAFASAIFVHQQRDPADAQTRTIFSASSSDGAIGFWQTTGSLCLAAM